MAHAERALISPLLPPCCSAACRQIVFLGTGSAIPSPGRRNTSAIALMLNNANTILMDCGKLEAQESNSKQRAPSDTRAFIHLCRPLLLSASAFVCQVRARSIS